MKGLFLKFVFLSVLGLAGFIVFLSGCMRKSESESADVVHVVTTTGFIASVAGDIAEGRAEVTALMGPGVDPHLYKASAGDIQRIRDADLVLYNGLHLESRLADVLEGLPDTRSLAVAEVLSDSELISDPNFDGSYDPHVWFDVGLWSKVSAGIADGLIEVDPEGESFYSDNLVLYQEELEALDREVRSLVLSIPEERRVLITAHDAFGYFSKAYGFEVYGLQGISTVAEAGARDVQELAEFIANRQIPAVFIESSVPRRAIEALQAAVRDRGFDVKIGGELFSDAMGEKGTVEGTYPGMIRYNIGTIVDALGGE